MFRYDFAEADNFKVCGFLESFFMIFYENLQINSVRAANKTDSE